MNGGDYRDRTDDLFAASEVTYLFLKVYIGLQSPV